MADTLPCPTQTALESIQDFMLPLVQTAKLYPERSAQLFRHESAIGSILLRDTSSSLYLRLSQLDRMTLEEPVVDPIRLEMSYIKWLDGSVEPMPLFSPLTFVVYMKSESAHYSQMYTPYRWPDGGTTIHNDRHEALTPHDILRVQQFAGEIVGEALYSHKEAVGF